MNSSPVIIPVNTEVELRAAADVWKQLDVVALDTEFIRTDTYYPILALVQLSDGETTWLVDPVALAQPQALIDLLADRSVTKVLHACSEDLETLGHSLGQIPEPIFDTQVAAAMLGMGYSLSYRALVQQISGVQLDKHETRSDWLRRPLSEAQQSYAAEDVHYLLPIFAAQQVRLQECHRESWADEEMAQRLESARNTVPLEMYYRRVKGAWRLDPKGLAILQVLCAWREQEAQARNRPRGRVVADRDLLNIAQHKPEKISDMRSEGYLPPRALRVYGEKIIRLVEQAMQLTDVPDALPQPLAKEQTQLLKKARALVDKAAQDLDMAPELLARKADLEFLIRSASAGQAELPKPLGSGWRYEAVGETLLAQSANY